MDKQKAIEIINDAPLGWECFATPNERFYREMFGSWFFFSGVKWVKCDKFATLHSTVESMMYKPEIFKVALEGEEMKYPAILKRNSLSRHQVVLSYNPHLTLHIEGDFIGEVSSRYDTSNATNITNEYLKNTYGEVQSPEHAEFIIELAELHGFELIANGTSNKNFFHIGEKSFAMLINEPTFKGDCKQITIPLPPKPYPLKNAGDNLILGCEDSTENPFDIVAGSVLRKNPESLGHEEPKCYEWPQVGENATLVSMGMTMYNKPVRLTYIGDGVGCYIDLTNSMEYTYAKRETVFKKPKTPEEELRDELVSAMDNSTTASVYAEYMAKYLIEKYNITKKPQ